MNSGNDPNETQIKQLLEGLQSVPRRDPDRAAQTRAKFLAEARHLRHEKRLLARNQAAIPAVAVSNGFFSRLNEWIHQMGQPFRRKELSPVFSTLVTILVTMMLVVGSTGGTVYAAQGSLPNDFLYPVKTLSEDIRLDAAVKAESQIALAMQFASRRVGEIAALASAGEAIPAEVIDRWLAETDLALQAAASLDTSEVPGALKHIERHLRDQDRDMGMVGTPDDVDPTLAQVQENIQNELMLVQAGQEDPLAFQHRFQYRMQGLPGQGPGEPAQGVISDTISCPDCDPLMNGSGPGFGPGPSPISDTMPCPECGPLMNGNGPGQPDGAGDGQIGEPGFGPGEPGYGPGSAVSPDPNPEPVPNPAPTSGQEPVPNPIPDPNPDPYGPGGMDGTGSGGSGQGSSGSSQNSQTTHQGR